MMVSHRASRTLQQLVRSELAATEVYAQALEKAEDESGVVELVWIANEHEQSLSLLRNQVRHWGEIPFVGSGAWAPPMLVVALAEKPLDDVEVLRALKEGEECEVEAYQEALDDVEVDDNCKNLIRQVLLRRQREHVSTLDRLLSQQCAEGN